ncbi:LOW PROTEIN: NUCLEASE-LIKE PROTEIN [Salix koriyanagi]|uniref:LOW PROTEIN: NUCLEASE-LIKE PROTEIN n=1 Tax=Salix koriyanagi TaxID=2511006 RepID=A0A9Q0W1X5_9ROSI|nr:LOW PROTEIN: NUCLEASE-LIKE PROTEIN [Salix koriyanagi]
MATAGDSSNPITPKPTTKKRKPRKPKLAAATAQHVISILNTASSAAHTFLSQNDLYLLPSQSLQLESLLSSLPPPFSQLPSQPSLFHRFASSATLDFDERWVQFFSVSRPNFYRLLSLLSPSLVIFLPSTIPPETALASALYRLAHGACYKTVARKFGLDSSEAACLAFYSVCKAVNDKLGDLFEFVIWRELWLALGGFRSQIAAVVWGLGGWPSSMEPVAIFRQTRLYLGVEDSRESELLKGPTYRLSDGCSIPQYVMGDSCFPLLPWLLTPYSEQDSFGSAEREFNVAHSRAMELVSTAFGRVKARWQLLARSWKEDSLEFFPFVIVMGCVLHNFLIKWGEPLPEESVGGCLKEEELLVFEGEGDETGQTIRDALAQHLSLASMRK